jgi:hypothetical protein
MILTYLLIGIVFGLFIQKNIIPIIENLFELIYLKLEHKKSSFAYDISLVNKEINELGNKSNMKGEVGFRIKGDNNA